MEDKKQDVNSLEELVKTVDSYRELFGNLANEISKLSADIKVPEKEEDTWEMKCPYQYNDEYFYINTSGNVFNNRWCDFYGEEETFAIGNIFPTRESALLEVKRRNLLTRFRAFRDECNGDWKADWEDCNEPKFYISFNFAGNKGLTTSYMHTLQTFVTFGYFKDFRACTDAIKLFGDEIKELFVEV